MKTVEQVMSELKRKGTEQTRKTYARHGAPNNMFGVKIADLKTIAKTIKGNQALAYELYETGNVDAMYLAGIVVDGSQMSKKQLNAWATSANWHMISESTVPAVATENVHARELALKWMKSKKESIASCGWCTYAGILATKPDDELDLSEIDELLNHVASQIHRSPNKVRYTMNMFVISVGSYVRPLLKRAKEVAKAIGPVSVDMGDTACQVPLASAYIEKIEAMGRIGKKRKTMRC
jgi:3-methyladenine DNA glycosylase AlkD